MLTTNKKTHRRTLDSMMRFTSAIGENTTINGQFSGGENIVVRGTVKGSSDITGLIVIMEGGYWEGTLVADVVVVAGRVAGDIEAREKVELAPGGHVIGDIRSPAIAMETGAIHEGRLHMRPVAAVVPVEEKPLNTMALST